MIFGLTHELLHKFKHVAKTAQKGKRKSHCSARFENRPAGRPALLGPRGRRARAPLSAWSLTSGSRSSVSPPSLTAVLPPLRRPLASSSAPARVRTSTASTLRLQSYHSRTLSRSLSTSTTQMADGRVGRRGPGTRVR